jgi:hypothetical protein
VFVWVALVFVWVALLRHCHLLLLVLVLVLMLVVVVVLLVVLAVGLLLLAVLVQQGWHILTAQILLTVQLVPALIELQEPVEQRFVAQVLVLPMLVPTAPPSQGHYPLMVYVLPPLLMQPTPTMPAVLTRPSWTRVTHCSNAPKKWVIVTYVHATFPWQLPMLRLLRLVIRVLPLQVVAPLLQALQIS